MQLKPGDILVCPAAPDDDYFDAAAVLLAECNDQGITGFIINKPAARPLNALVEFSGSPAFPLYRGGPVDTEHLFFIHRRADLIGGGQPFSGDLFLGGDFKQAVQLIDRGVVTEEELKIFIGYCGQDPGGLEAELAAGDWTLTAQEGTAAFALQGL